MWRNVCQLPIYINKMIAKILDKEILEIGTKQYKTIFSNIPKY